MRLRSRGPVSAENLKKKGLKFSLYIPKIKKQDKREIINKILNVSEH